MPGGRSVERGGEKIRGEERVQVKEVVEGTEEGGRAEGREDRGEMHLTHQDAERVRDCRMRSQRAQPIARTNHLSPYPALRLASRFRMYHHQKVPPLTLGNTAESFFLADARGPRLIGPPCLMYRSSLEI
ncbi:hypothetical protein KM043_007068 [Ampulex compressa]|nr:hypothetical protein KM043_007068 [Ampulex compressa]